MTEREQKYLDKQLNLIDAAISGAIVACFMFGAESHEKRHHVKETAMRLIKGDVMRIYKHGKRIGRWNN